MPLEPASPSANSNASRIFDLPEPLGPETTVNPVSSGIDTVEPKDLNLVSSTFLMYIFDIRSGDRGHTQQKSSVAIFLLSLGCQFLTA